MTIDCIDQISGAAELRDWFGGFPSFHDADMEFVVKSDGTGWLRAFGARMTSKIDENGYFISEKHFAATFYFEEVLSASLTDFLPAWPYWVVWSSARRGKRSRWISSTLRMACRDS
jgi:hypothetical protein